MMNYSKQITYNTFGTVVTLFCQWLIIMFIPKITDFAEAGIFAVAISVCSILNHIATFSLKEFQISDQNTRYTDADYKSVRLITIALSFIGIIPFIFVFGYGVEETLVIVAYLIYRNLLHYAYLYSASLQIAERLDYVGIWTAAEGFVSFFSFMATYILTGNLFLSTLIMAIMGGGLFLISQYSGYVKNIKRESTEKFSWKHTRSLLLIGVPLLLSILFPTFTTALPKLILQAQCSDAIAGIFSTLSTPTIIVPTLAISAFAPFIVMFAKTARSGDLYTLRSKYLKIVFILLGFGALCALASIFLQGPVFEKLSGEEVKEYSKYFVYLVIGITFYSIGTVGTTVLITKDQGRLGAISSFISFAIGTLTCMLLIPEMEIAGATYALIISYGAYGAMISACVCIAPLKTRRNNEE